MWFRRDLRAIDNAAFHHALKSCEQLFCVFVFDRDILDDLPRSDRRVEFIRESLVNLDIQLRDLGNLGNLANRSGSQDTGLIVLHGAGHEAVTQLATELAANAVFANRDYEPYALTRDAEVRARLELSSVAFHTFKDHVIFEGTELMTQGGKPYSVFTPYKNAWLKKVDDFYLKSYSIDSYAAVLALLPVGHRGGVPSLADIGFKTTNLAELNLPAGSSGAQQLLADFAGRMKDYGDTRNFPAIKGPSYLSVHLRFGTVSIRQLAALALTRQTSGSEGAAVWLSELIWRDFYAQILANFPHVAGSAFKPEYDRISWQDGATAKALFEAWCEGKTGYPLVDAAMAQINQTGYMHNRLRMVVASFLIKDLGIDWRWGERYFAEKLNDFDLASNNGGWQWAASSGCDAQPYFRIFNPISQSEKFDPEGKFIRRYLPLLATLPTKALHAPWLANATELLEAGVELGGNYPVPIIAHDEARTETLKRYAVVKKAPG